MRNVTLAIVAIVSVLVSNAQSQSVPPGWQFPVNDLEIYEVATFNHSQLIAEDTQIESEGGRTNHGRLAPFSATMETHGVWSDLPDGGRVWRFRFNTEGALGTAVYFDGYHIPVGAAAYIYPADRSWVEGPYDHTDNNDHGYMTTAEVPGGDAVLEYFEPAGVVGAPSMDIRGIAHFYRYVYFHEDETRGSDPCEVDVNCPEGSGWEPMRDAVVRLRIVDGGFIGLCSGVLVNNTSLDCRRFMLTALHCADGLSDQDFLSLQCRFNFELQNCGSGGGASSRNKTGVFRLADSNDGGGNSGSDFLLTELEDEIPEAWNPFYAGWDASGQSSSFGVCIHHPAGDWKKISTYDDPLQSVWIGAPNSHWEVRWVETETNHGVTEGGSSGSPIFTPSGKVIGTLTGGTSFCNTPNQPDFYGRMSYHWTSNPNPASEKLKVWLDPNDTGIEKLDGGYAPNCGEWFLSTHVDEFSFSDIALFPNPATDVVEVTVSNAHEIQDLVIYDGIGRPIRSVVPSNAERRFTVDVQELASGVYYFTFTDRANRQVTQKLIIQ